MTGPESTLSPAPGRRIAPDGAADVCPDVSVESAVRERYSGAARAREESLCCPTSYDARLLAGFYGVAILARGDEPWRTVEGIELRSVTIVAYKGKEGPCVDRKHAVIYRGPFREVVDDGGHVLRRGARAAVCEKTFGLYAAEPYRAHVELVPPRELPPVEESPPFPCDAAGLLRDPRETKGADYRLTTEERPAACATGSGQRGEPSAGPSQARRGDSSPLRTPGSCC